MLSILFRRQLNNLLISRSLENNTLSSYDEWKIQRLGGRNVAKRGVVVSSSLRQEFVRFIRKCPLAYEIDI